MNAEIKKVVELYQKMYFIHLEDIRFLRETYKRAILEKDECLLALLQDTYGSYINAKPTQLVIDFYNFIGQFYKDETKFKQCVFSWWLDYYCQKCNDVHCVEGQKIYGRLDKPPCYEMNEDEYCAYMSFRQTFGVEYSARELKFFLEEFFNLKEEEKREKLWEKFLDFLEKNSEKTFQNLRSACAVTQFFNTHCDCGSSHHTIENYCVYALATRKVCYVFTQQDKETWNRVMEKIEKLPKNQSGLHEYKGKDVLNFIH